MVSVLIMAEKPTAPAPQAVSFVTVNSGQKGGVGGRLYVTPLPSHGPTLIPGSGPTPPPTTSSLATLQPPLILSKLLLKAVSKTTKKSKVFTLRDINVNNVTSVEVLKQIIKKQLTHDITSDFDVGYIQGTNIISVRGEKDLNDIWRGVQKQGATTLLWCDGLKVKGEKRKKSSEVDTGSSDEDIAVKSKKSSKDAMKQKAVMKTFNELQDKHGGTYTQVQYRIWSEMINGGMYSSLIDPPNTSMFQRAGGIDRKKNTSAVSPSKSVDVRSKCYKQLSELSTLKSNGILTLEEYEREKKAIMLTLKDL